MTIAIGVEESHKTVGFGAGDLDLDLAETRVELIGIDLLVSIEGVEVSESSSETSDCLCTAGNELLSYSLEDYKQEECQGLACIRDFCNARK